MGGENELFKNLNSMMGNAMNLDQAGPGGEGLPEMDENMLDKYADLLLNQMIDKEIIYEPLVDAKKQMEVFFEKENIQLNSFSKNKTTTEILENKTGESELSEEEKKKAIKQYGLICEIIDLVDMEEKDQNDNHKEKIKDKFEELHESGGLPKQLMGNDEFMTFLNGKNMEFNTNDFFGSNKDDPECRIF